MIREIINFTSDLISDIPGIMQWKVLPNNGLHIFVDLDKEGHLKNDMKYGVDYYYYQEGNDDRIISTIIAYENEGKRVGTTMNKVLDKNKQIFSCSPFIVSFKKKSILSEENKQKVLDLKKIIPIIPGYLDAADKACAIDDNLIQLSKAFGLSCEVILNKIKDFVISQTDKNGVATDVSIFDKMKDDEYVSLYLRNVPLEKYKEAHDVYLTEKLFNDNKYNNQKSITDETFGLSGFLNGLNAKKPFLVHRTASEFKGISGRVQAKEARALNDFETLLSNKVLPNPLPIVIDRREINRKCISIFNEGKPLSYREIIKRLFSDENVEELSNYYLLNYTKRKSIVINDIDFVPLFKYVFPSKLVIENVTEVFLNKESGKENDIKIDTVFDFERIVVREIFNNSLVKIKEDRYSTNYFEDIDPQYVSGGDVMFLLIMKYRKAFYDYIYKSKTNAINTLMFDDMMYNSILSDIRTDEYTNEKHTKSLKQTNNESQAEHEHRNEKHTKFFSIKRKINIWFSLYKLFNNNKNTVIMASKVTDLMSKMRSVVKGDSILETPEEFAFGAGQIVSYLIDRSVASDKTYALLEPYLQKTKSNFLQDSISQSIATYKHDIRTNKGPFQALASNVLTFDENVDMKPLLKYFLAGCFCSCVIYDKKQSDNN